MRKIDHNFTRSMLEQSKLGIDMIPSIKWSLKDMSDQTIEFDPLPPGEEDRTFYGQAIARALIHTSYEVEQQMPHEYVVTHVGEFGCRVNSHPALPIEDYIVGRLIKYTRATNQDLVMAVILMDHLLFKGHILLSWRTMHRLYATALLLALKFMEDSCYTNSYYAQVYGISKHEMNLLETEFLRQIDFNVWISQTEINQYQHYIHRIALVLKSEHVQWECYVDSLTHVLSI